MAMFAISKIQVWHFTIKVETVRSEKTELEGVSVCSMPVIADERTTDFSHSSYGGDKTSAV